MRLKGKVAIITGAGSGIGRASSLFFASEGARVVVADIAEDAGRETVRLIRERGAEAIFVRTDVSKADEVRAMVASSVETFGTLDVLFNNAGYYDHQGPVADVPEEIWELTIDVNLKGTYLGAKYAIPEMIKNGRGSIINTASCLGLVAASNYAAYCAAKGGIVLLTRSIAVDYGRHNIRCNAICPGVIATKVNEEIRSQPGGLERLMAPLLVNYIGQPEDIAHLAVYLASDESRYVTGAAISIDGGYTAR